MVINDDPGWSSSWKSCGVTARMQQLSFLMIWRWVSRDETTLLFMAFVIFAWRREEQTYGKIKLRLPAC